MASEPLTDAKLAEWRKLCEAATAGPWYARDCEFMGEGTGCWHAQLRRASVEEEKAAGQPDEMTLFGTTSCTEEDAHFIAAAREAVPALLDEVERLRKRLLTAAGDDLCRLAQEEIKAMSLGSVQIPPKEEFLASCERFHAQVANESGVLGNCLTLAQLVAENERLRAALWPFAELESGWTAGEPDALTITELGKRGLCGGPTLGHCRAAKAALAE